MSRAHALAMSAQHPQPIDPAGEPDGSAFLPGGVGPDVFRGAFRNHPAGVAVITADPGSGPVGMTATSVVSVSAEPPLLIFSLSALSSAAPGIRAARTVVVHLLADTDVPLARLCATSGVDRFADRALWSPLATGEPLFHGVASWLRCRVVERMETPGSTVVVAEAIQAPPAGPPADPADPAPLVYHHRRWHRLDEHSVIS